ncbi:hypothetical protein BKA64DRAFT_12988 [Cadophora sp. MPI-SDFR-AT-0126]|nr:hypothetical protein BKA64DRAFT_12988 [Leotiomycetes sp. MPI-SDFR-AT-0126]
MAPNLFLLAKKAVSPWTWCSFQLKSESDRPHLFFCREPITGIYAISPRGKRYLVAMKPKRNPDVDGIFQKTRNSICGESELAKKVTTPTSETTEYIKSTELYDENAKTIVKVTVTELPRDVSPSSTTTTSTHTSPNTHCTSTSSSCSPCKKSPVVPTDKPVNTVDYIMNNTGVLPHQKSPFGKESHRYLRQSRSPTRSAKTKISQIDLNGYRFLKKPVQVEYNNILGRWMFCSEVKARTVSAPMYRSITCMESDMRVCGKPVYRDLFALDDGVPWVVGNAKRKDPYKDGEFLFTMDMVDDEWALPRRQRMQEVEESRALLEKRRGMFMVFDEQDESVALLRYLDLPFVDV